MWLEISGVSGFTFKLSVRAVVTVHLWQFQAAAIFKTA